MSSTWKTVAGKVASYAPMIGTILGGPVGAAVGTVGSMVASAMGVEPTPVAVDNALKNNPEAAIKIRELEIAEAANIRQIAFEHHRLIVMDRMNARKTHGSHWMTIALPAVLLAFVAWVTYTLINQTIPAETRDVVFYIVGQVLTMTVAAVAYWIGTTRSSSEKNEILGARR